MSSCRAVATRPTAPSTAALLRGARSLSRWALAGSRGSSARWRRRGCCCPSLCPRTPTPVASFASRLRRTWPPRHRRRSRPRTTTPRRQRTTSTATTTTGLHPVPRTRSACGHPHRRHRRPRRGRAAGFYGLPGAFAAPRQSINGRGPTTRCGAPSGRIRPRSRSRLRRPAPGGRLLACRSRSRKRAATSTRISCRCCCRSG